MQRARSLVLALVASLSGLAPSFAQHTAPAPTEARSEQAVITGLVHTASGEPAVGALVISGKGGKTQTLPDGSFELTVSLPHTQRSLRITAFQGAGQNAATVSALVAVGPDQRSPSIGKLQLQINGACTAAWLPTFGGQPGVGAATISGDSIYCLAVYDDGSGPALFVGGDFLFAGGQRVDCIARWDGAGWSAVEGGVSGAGNPTTHIAAFAVHDPGTGPVLYMGGDFDTAGGQPAAYIATWDGTEWGTVAAGFNRPVQALGVFDDGTGTGEQLYAGGDFFTAIGIGPRAHIAKWNGTTWRKLGSGLDSGNFGIETVRALAVYDDGTGPALFAAGAFKTADGLPANRIAKWDGSSWTALGSGLTGGAATAYALVVHDDGQGGGQQLYAGGKFLNAGGTGSSFIARWNGTAWSGVGSSVNNNVFSLGVFDDGQGGGPALYAGGSFDDVGGVPMQTLERLNHIARWDGLQWSSLESGVDALQGSLVRAFSSFDSGTGARLYAAGRSLTSAGGAQIQRIGAWDGTRWFPVGVGVTQGVLALTPHDDGSGQSLYAGGLFTSAGDLKANRVAAWDQAGWRALGSGMDGSVLALDEFSSGGATELFAGGVFQNAGGLPASGIARWDGVAWDALGSGVVPADVHCFATHDDGSGPALIVGGGFTLAGGVPANRIARWDGTTWSALGSGFDGRVSKLCTFDAGDGAGPQLYAGGSFSTADGLPALNIARWDGSAWHPVGAGLDSQAGPTGVYALSVFDDGQGAGPALYAGGRFTRSGATNLPYIARWDGVAWSPAGSQPFWVTELFVHDDGSGERLFSASDDYASEGGLTAWNGVDWSTLGASPNGSVQALEAFDAGDGAGLALVAGGYFTRIASSGDSYLARWGGCGGFETYCSPGLSDQGCEVLISADGFPSATVSSGFNLRAWAAPPNRSGLFYFGSNGRQASPWGNGSSFQCVVPPLKRGPLLTSSTSPDPCVGQYALDLNALWCASCPQPAKNPGAGAVVQAQLWYRDAFNTSNQTSSMSDAIEFTVAP